MGANVIRIAKDKADLVKGLTDSERTNGPFPTHADAVMFAAALGARRKRRSPLREISKRDPAPIGLEIFVSRGYEMAIKLLAIAATRDSQILSSLNETYNEERNQIFEEYANGGLEILRDELRGAVDYTERLILMLMEERNHKKPTEERGFFDLSRFL
ncbi:MAG: DNA phosphorothioation-associated protein 4 [Oscillatoria sp. SIO1A7]|nr:DNA phosphorothioation-associated protein 4 [Oscillatoria sp. SIO1A7]